MVSAPAILGETKTSPILIRNVYYLLLYAWELYSEGAATEVAAIEADALQNLFAQVLGNGVRRLLRRGTDRSYKSFTEETAMPRGSFLLAESMRPGPRSKGTVYCSFDELSSDVPHNRVVKATLRLLGKDQELTSSLRIEMKSLVSRMTEIRDVPLSMDLFRSVHLGRNNRHYRVMIKICELIFLSQIPGEGDEQTRFAKLLDDELRMSNIFERFVRTLYKTELTEFKVRAEEVAWDATFLTPDHLSYLPQMRTDMTIRGPGRTIVVDTKYYREILRSRMGGLPKLRSEHLYQLLTYLRQVRSDNTFPHVADGMLLYARAGGTDLALEYVMGEFSLRIHTINLDVPWDIIKSKLLALISTRPSKSLTH